MATETKYICDRCGETRIGDTSFLYTGCFKVHFRGNIISSTPDMGICDACARGMIDACNRVMTSFSEHNNSIVDLIGLSPKAQVLRLLDANKKLIDAYESQRKEIERERAENGEGHLKLLKAYNKEVFISNAIDTAHEKLPEEHKHVMEELISLMRNDNAKEDS